MKDFNLTYWHRVTGEKLEVKRIVLGQYRVREPGNPEVRSISKYLLDKDYEPDPANFKHGLSTMKNVGRSRKVKTRSKAFQDYLNGRTA